MSERQRIDAGRELFQRRGGEVKHREDIFLVPDGDVSHRVDFDNETCTCEPFREEGSCLHQYVAVLASAKLHAKRTKA